VESLRGAGDHVVEREFAGGKRDAAILAGVAVAQQNVFRERARDWCGMRRYSSKRMTEGTRSARRAACRKCPFSSSVIATPFSHEHDGAAGSADVDRLIRSVEHEDGLMQGMAVAFGVHAGGEHGRGKVRTHAASEIV